jgi:hypothetical protein
MSGRKNDEGARFFSTATRGDDLRGQASQEHEHHTEEAEEAAEPTGHAPSPPGSYALHMWVRFVVIN